MIEDELYLHCDFHVHTVHSPCAQPEMLPASIIEQAKQKGIRYLGFSDHVFGFTDPDILRQARLETPESDDLQIFFGCEADVLSVGKTTVTQEMRDSLDYIMVAANHFNNDWVKMVELPPTGELEVIGRHFLNMFNYAASLDYADVIVHPFYVMPGTYNVRAIYTIDQNDLIPGIEAAAANNVAVEISRRSITPDHIDFLTPFYRRCKEAGVKFSIGSDAHNLDTVGQVSILKPLIQDLGLRADDYWLPTKNGGN